MSTTAGGANPGPRIVLVQMDRVECSTTLVRSDGKEAVFPMPSLRGESSSRIRSISWAPGVNGLHFKTLDGDDIVAELPTLNDPAPLNGRRVVYLDQNHWSTLANAVHDPARVPSRELDAAQNIVDLAVARRIVLPMSAGHMTETCKWTDGARRYRLALTILQLSRGWQMRNPLDLRRFELRQALTVRYKNRCLLPPATFTLEAGALHGSTPDSEPVRSPPDFPPELAFLHRAQTTTSAIFDTMLDGEPIEIDESHGWTKRLQEFTDWLGAEPATNDHLRRLRTSGFFIGDLLVELPEEAYRAGATPEQMSEWTLTHSDADLAEMPSLGLFREAMREKLLNPGTVWESNDLTDLMYLTCAAGYADEVVAERSLVGQMRQGLRRLGRRMNVHRNLRELSEQLAITL